MTDDGYTLAIERPAPFAIPSPQAMREGMVADEIALAARVGKPMDPRDAERLVARDLALFDAVEREAPRPAAPSTTDPTEAANAHRARAQERSAALAEVDASMPALVDARKSRVLQATTLPDDRWSYAKGRMARLLQGYGTHPNPDIAAATCDQPKLAVEIVVLMHACARTQAYRQKGRWPRRRPRYEASNPFWGVSRRDFGRVLQRLAEDICDRSTGMPGYGPWLVPK